MGTRPSALEGVSRPLNDPPARAPIRKNAALRDDAGRHTSYSGWEDEDCISTYLASEDHQEIKRHNTNIPGAQVVVKKYHLVR